MSHQIPKERASYMMTRRLKQRDMGMRRLGYRCRDCGEDDPRVLEFHHVRPEHKSFNLAHRWSDAWANIVAEIDKCVLICANCHRRRHHKRPEGGRRTH